MLMVGLDDPNLFYDSMISALAHHREDGRVTANESGWKVEAWSLELSKLGREDGILLGAIPHRPKNRLVCSSSL